VPNSTETHRKPTLVKKGLEGVVMPVKKIESVQGYIDKVETNKRPVKVTIESCGQRVDREKMKEMRRIGGSFEYTRITDGYKETRMDISCGYQEVVMKEINKLLQAFHPYLQSVDISQKVDFGDPKARIRLPKCGLELNLSLDRGGLPKYNILFLGKHIGEILYHPDGHGEEYSDANAALPHYNLVIDHHPDYGYLHTHLTLTK
jgi:hypothetical protein